MNSVIFQLNGYFAEIAAAEVDEQSVYAAGVGLGGKPFRNEFMGYDNPTLYSTVSDNVFADYAPMVNKLWGIADIMGDDIANEARLKYCRIQSDFKKAMVAQRDAEIAYNKMVRQAMWDGTDLCEDVMGIIMEYL